MQSYSQLYPKGKARLDAITVYYASKYAIQVAHRTSNPTMKNPRRPTMEPFICGGMVPPPASEGPGGGTSGVAVGTPTVVVDAPEPELARSPYGYLQTRNLLLELAYEEAKYEDVEFPSV